MIGNADISSPGLALAGFVGRFMSERSQVIGETEMTYLASLSPTRRRKVMDLFFSFEIPCVVVTTTGFSVLARLTGRSGGIADLNIAEYPGPLGIHSPDQITHFAGFEVPQLQQGFVRGDVGDRHRARLRPSEPRWHQRGECGVGKCY